MVMDKRLNKGFTLIELLVVIALTAIMAAIAVPNMSRFIAGQRLQSKADQIQTFFQYARTESIRLNLPVVICLTGFLQGGAGSSTCNNLNDTTQANRQGLIAWRDNALNTIFVAGQTIRTVPINQSNDTARTILNIVAVDANQNQVRNLVRARITPNGMMAWTTQITAGDNTATWPANTTGTGFLLLTLTDANNAGIQRRIVIYPSGHSIVCPTAVNQQNQLCRLAITA